MMQRREFFKSAAALASSVALGLPASGAAAESRKRSYGNNGWLDTGNYSISALIIGTSGDWKYASETSVRRASSTPVFADAVWVDGWPQETEGPAKDHYNGGNNTFMGRFTVARHLGVAPAAAPRNITASSGLGGGIEVAFMDGPAGPVRLPPLWTLDWHNN